MRNGVFARQWRKLIIKVLIDAYNGFVYFSMIYRFLLVSCELTLFPGSERCAENTYGFLRIILQCG